MAACPGQTLGTRELSNFAQWGAAPLHIPDGEGGSYKTELALFRSEERTEKILWWHKPDPRRDPHNHPWPFKSTILHGGYTETRYYMEKDHLRVEEHTYRVGDVNDIAADVYHTVDEVLPGTVTHMVCGKAVDGPNWGYLGSKDGLPIHVPSANDPDFFGKLVAINPHKAPQ